MSYAIAHPVAARRGGVAFGALRTLLLSLLMLVSHGVWAEPAAATQDLALAKQNFTLLKQNYQIAKTQLQLGQPTAATVSFSMARAQAVQMSSNLTATLFENQDSLQRGLYRDGVSQQRAVQHNDVAKSQSQLLQTKLLILSLQPTSQIDLILADQTIARLTSELLQLEQAMIAAQQ
ncbi:hypothetical protein [Lysobacter sp. TAB13]|uniref:hypothetical protein n=1 Tax=Lysobacter sp. TAB13 TaxID=3233065 RepID=UPI003F95A989